ncbi:hypothetical protein BSKO_11655 [Bryopsis sp. KO-2023]|nr:hypothetical protein BSKO_11655 [Bryopsis sp. KO-2023]
MATINIGAENGSDPFHRYKMPKPVAKIEGRGNGIKTNVVNNVDIAKALERPASYIIKYFGFELGALTTYDSKIGTSIVNGAHDANTLMRLTESFIKKYVQCYSCGNPETVIKIKKETIRLKCKACGSESNVDMKHKMNNYILKNPPEIKLSKAEKKLKKQEKERLGALEKEGRSSSKKDKKEEKEKKKKDKKKKKGEESGDGGNKENDEKEGESPKESPPPTPEEAPQSENDDDGGDDDDVTWSTDVSAAAIKRRAEEQLSGAVSAMVTQGNIESERKERKKRIKKALSSLGLDDSVVDAIYDVNKLLRSPDVKEIEAALKQAAPKAAVRMQILYVALLWEVEGKLSEVIKENASVLEAFAKDAKELVAQLIAVEYALGIALPDRCKEASSVLNALYEADIIDAEYIIGWYERPSVGEQALGIPLATATLVRQHAEKLVEFLQEESEDEDEDDDDDDEEEE